MITALDPQPLCPMDVPEEIWFEVAKQYNYAEWDPAPNYHVEYRDCRIAYQATLALMNRTTTSNSEGGQ